MNILNPKIALIGLLLVIVFSCSENNKNDDLEIDISTSTVINEMNFNDGTVPNNWRIGAQKGASYSFEESDISEVGSFTNLALKVNYPIPIGESYFWLNYTLPSSQNITDIAIDFWAKMPSESKFGMKFVKVFGSKSVDGGYANTTFGLDYTGIDNGALYSVSFGDGTEKQNDTQNIIRLDGKEPNLIGRSFNTALVETPQNEYWASDYWGTDWHHFKFRLKFNSGTTKENEVADGEYYIEIDGKVYVNAKGVFNRHYSNLPIKEISFGGWSQKGTNPFEIWLDNIKISTGGFTE
ncbi:hypothetical protein [Tenacibaculum caenipelagi]|uniref:Polysaccharide lyase-like protein n=1 Tax=Tenacibaculum caenipelagi TaxID=1325435 RepID=A0A4R6TCL6_9FLAO|nr:hypothetical protein [Tenacibaculum caenipelagi]TDQ25763.1 hypothetical protein DFQ07_2194 [Tenacibaculum caenipelagi]